MRPAFALPGRPEFGEPEPETAEQKLHTYDTAQSGRIELAATWNCATSLGNGTTELTYYRHGRRTPPVR